MDKFEKEKIKIQKELVKSIGLIVLISCYVFLNFLVCISSFINNGIGIGNVILLIVSIIQVILIGQLAVIRARSFVLDMDLVWLKRCGKCIDEMSRLYIKGENDE